MNVMTRVFFTALILVSVVAAAPAVAEPLPSSLFIDDVQIYDVPQGKRRTVTCAQRRSLDEPLFAGTVVTKLSENYLETVTFVPLDEAFKRLKRRARKARGNKRTRLARRVQKTAKKMRTCKKGVGATVAVLGNFSCPFWQKFNACDNTACSSYSRSGAVGSGSSLSDAYQNGWAECLQEIDLRFNLVSRILSPVRGESMSITDGKGCSLGGGCVIDPAGVTWSIYRCSATGAYKRCPKGEPNSTSCEEDLLVGTAQENGRQLAMERAMQDCEAQDFAVKEEAAAFDGLDAYKTRECVPYGCSRFITDAE